MVRRVGSRQHRFMYGGPKPFEMQPFRFKPADGKPPAVLRNLVAKGWMWAERRERLTWMPRKQQWSGPLPGADYWCGLTKKGLMVIEGIRDASMREYEEQKAKEAPCT